jgi:hypothetical protein
MTSYMTKYAPSGVPREPDPISTIRPSNDKDIPTITIPKNNHPVNPRSRYHQSNCGLLSLFFICFAFCARSKHG